MLWAQCEHCAIAVHAAGVGRAIEPEQRSGWAARAGKQSTAGIGAIAAAGETVKDVLCHLAISRL